LEISPDSGLFGRLWEPVAKRIQQLAANSLFLRKQGIFLPEQGMFPLEQGNYQAVCRVGLMTAWLRDPSINKNINITIVLF
jgi:hypothetical protein